MAKSVGTEQLKNKVINYRKYYSKLSQCLYACFGSWLRGLDGPFI